MHYKGEIGDKSTFVASAYGTYFHGGFPNGLIDILDGIVFVSTNAALNRMWHSPSTASQIPNWVQVIHIQQIKQPKPPIIATIEHRSKRDMRCGFQLWVPHGLIWDDEYANWNWYAGNREVPGGLHSLPGYTRLAL